MFNKQGFSLLEVIIAIAILGTGIAGAVALITQTISTGSSVTKQLIAAHLAQEGLEVIHNLRHTNWIKEAEDGITKWYDGLDKPDCTPGPPADSSCPTPIYAVVNYNSSSITQNSDPAAWQMSFNGLRYIHDSLSPVFSRHIEISYALDDAKDPACTEDDVYYMLVKSIVTWDTGSITAEDKLYNWKAKPITCP